MDHVTAKTAADAIQRDVRIGWCTGAFIVALRAPVLVGVLSGNLPLDWFAAQGLLQLGLAVAFTYGVYRRRMWGAVGLLVVWGLGYFYSWYALGRGWPPLGFIGVLVWYGLYRGLRGVRASVAQQPGAFAGV